MIKCLAIASLAVVAMAGPARAAAAKPFLSPVFSSHMVLQRDMADPIWGWSEPGTVVTVTVGTKSVTATADADGRWQAALPSMPASADPVTMTVKAPNHSDIALDDILVGDVWIGSGQSNMQLNVNATNDAKTEVANADHPLIRLFNVPIKTALEPQPTCDGRWERCTPETVPGFSAVAYYFGRDLQNKLKIPIGLIHTSVGGTPAESWTSEPMLRKRLPEFNTELDAIASFRGKTDSLDDWYKTHDPGTAGNWQAADFNDSAWKSMDLPKYYQLGDPTLANANGIIWFRKTFDLPADANGPGTLHLLVDDNDKTFVNGVEVGATDGYGAIREYEIPTNLLRRSGNVIAVRCHDTGGMGGIYGETGDLFLSVGKTRIPLAGAWKYDFSVSLEKLGAFPDGPAKIRKDTNNPSVLFNAMINPLIPFGFKGVIWYQGESNAWSHRDDRHLHDINGPAEYRTLLPAMIEDWRTRWGEGDFPFLIVQLAGFGKPAEQPVDDDWAELRAAQWDVHLKQKNVGIMTAIDIGESGNIHPKNKQEVGRRLSLVALHDVYGRDLTAYGPVYKSMTIEHDTIRLQFDQTDGGIKSTTPKLQGFAIAGADGKFVWADAKIEGNVVIVSSPQIAHPTKATYAWAGFTPNTLVNSAGLPAFPFRTFAD